MKMKRLFNPALVSRRWLPALALTTGLSGIACVSHATVPTAPAAQARAILTYLTRLEHECRTNSNLVCSIGLRMHWAPPLLPFTDDDDMKYMRAM